MQPAKGAAEVMVRSTAHAPTTSSSTTVVAGFPSQRAVAIMVTPTAMKAATRAVQAITQVISPTSFGSQLYGGVGKTRLQNTITRVVRGERSR